MILSAIILTKNEEDKIKKCLESLQFCDEIIVIDDNSSDKTLDIAQKFDNVKIFKKNLDGNFAVQRNFGMEKASGKWILFIDADEEMSKDLEKEIIKTTKLLEDDNNAYYIKRRDIFWGKELKFGEVYEAAHKGFIRLVKKGKGSWYGNVHEVFFVNSGDVGALENYLIHRPHKDLKSFIEKINFYSSIRAEELYKSRKKTNGFEIIFYPFLKFLYTYIVKLGVVDGLKGFVYCFMMSFHSFLVRSKLYMMTNDEKDN
jgi:glycosyltransferase involved in cell wall biosynthesis